MGEAALLLAPGGSTITTPPPASALGFGLGFLAGIEEKNERMSMAPRAAAELARAGSTRRRGSSRRACATATHTLTAKPHPLRFEKDLRQVGRSAAMSRLETLDVGDLEALNAGGLDDDQERDGEQRAKDRLLNAVDGGGGGGGKPRLSSAQVHRGQPRRPGASGCRGS